MKKYFSAFFILFFVFSFESIADDEINENTIVIDNAPFSLPDDSIVLPLVGFRSFTPHAPVRYANTSSKSAYSISTETIKEAALGNEEVEKKIKELWGTTKNLDTSQIKEAVIASDYFKKMISSDGPIYINKNQKLVSGEFYDIATSGQTNPILFNSDVVLNFVSTGVIDTNKISYIKSSGIVKEFAQIDKKYNDNIFGIYNKIYTISSQSGPSTPKNMEYVKQLAYSHYPIQKSLLVTVGKITFGRPIYRFADELGFSFPESINRNYKVLWVELTVTYRDIEPNDIEEISFNVSLPEDQFAIEMFPLRTGIDMEVGETTKSPDVTVGGKELQFSLGTFYEKNLVFKYLRPTVIGFGLRESEFSWTLKDEAVSVGSHRFSALIAAPKKIKKIKLDISAHVKTKDRLLIDGKIATTQVKEFRYEIN